MSDGPSVAEKVTALAIIFAKDRDIILINSTFYKFNGQIWKEENGKIVAHQIKKEWLKAYGCPTTNNINEVISHIEFETHGIYGTQIKELGTTEDNHYEIYCKSGVLDLNTKKTRKYTKEDFVFTTLPFDYKPLGKGSGSKIKSFQNYLKSTFGFNNLDKSNIDDFKIVVAFIQEWLGYSFLMGNPLEKALIMIGEGRNGKGVLLYLWGKLVGRDNISYVDLKGINNSQEIIMTKNKLLNISNDLEQGQQLDSGVVKSFVSGEQVLANGKYKDPETFNATAKIVIACNELPYIKKVGTAVQQRFQVLPFNQEFTGGEQNRNLKYELEEESEFIFSWCVNGLINLTERGHFIEPARAVTSLTDYVDSFDAVKEWLEESDNLKKGEGCKCKRTKLYEDFKNYCKDMGKRSVSNRKFYQRLEKLGYEKYDTQGTTNFKGLQIKEIVYQWMNQG